MVKMTFHNLINTQIFLNVKILVNSKIYVYFTVRKSCLKQKIRYKLSYFLSIIKNTLSNFKTKG